jgi:hypothetical protein
MKQKVKKTSTDNNRNSESIPVRFIEVNNKQLNFFLKANKRNSKFNKKT